MKQLLLFLPITAVLLAAAPAADAQPQRKAPMDAENSHRATTHSTTMPTAVPCLGFGPDGTWSKKVREVRESGLVYDHFVCPAHTAILSVFKQAMKPLQGRYIGIDANCCPLPSADVLVEEHLEVETECPDEFVATGGHLHRYGNEKVRPLRCTKINIARYQLGPRTGGVFWGASGSAAFPMQEAQRIKVSDIALGLRVGATRYGPNTAWYAGCIGRPQGSLLVGKHSKRCTGHVFRELQYRGAVGDPPRGTAVAVIPDCSYLDEELGPAAHCSFDQELENFRQR